MKKVVVSLILCFSLLVGLFTISASAATGNLSIGVSGALNPGKEITVSVTVTAPSDVSFFGAFDAIVDYDTSYLQLVKTSEGITSASGAVPISSTKGGIGTKQLTCTITFKTLKAGNTTISVRDVVTDDFDVGATAKNISIVAPTKSSDNTLKRITISAGTLSPAFSPNVTEYKVTVPYSVDYFSIDGYKNHSGATVSYSTGDKGPNIKVGTTVRTITVTAENGAVRKYNITVTRLPQETTSSSTSSNDTSSSTSSNDTSSTTNPEENKLEVNVDGNKMTVAEVIPEEVTLPGFFKGEYTFNSVHVPAFLDKDGKIVVLYLLDEENKGALYIYDSATGLFKKPLTVAGGKMYTVFPATLITRDQILIDIDNVFSLSTVTIGEQEVAAYVYKDEKLSDFAIVCAINEEGNKGFYRYDKAEGTLQRYVAEFREENKTLASTNGIILNDTIVVISCAAACIVAIIAIIVIWAIRRKRFLEEFEDDFNDEPLFVKETEFDENDEAENFADESEMEENDQTDGENEAEEE